MFGNKKEKTMSSESEDSEEMYSSHTETETDSKTETETESDTDNDSKSNYSDEESIDEKEEEANRKAREGGVQDDPFQKRIPQSFYDNEAKKLGPLEKPWEKALSGKKAYYVSHKTKTTTWVDPRTSKTRIHDIMKCKMGELPYGWDEEIDPEIGVYYIDHNTRSTFLDPPWDPRIQFQVSQLSKFLADQIDIYQKKLAELEAQRKKEEEEKNSEKEQLLKEKKKLEDEIRKLRQQATQPSESEFSDESESDDMLLPESANDFQQRLKELMFLQQKLTNAGSGNDEVEEFKQTKEEIFRVQQMLEEEERNRNKILQDIEKLKGEIANVISTTESSDLSAPTPKQRSEPNKKAQLTRKTRYEMEVELLMLKKKLQGEKANNQRLQAIQSKVTDKEGALPTWVKKIEEVASSSKTLRVKIAQKQASGPDALSFRERMLFFASTVAESKTPGVIPPPPTKNVYGTPGNGNGPVKVPPPAVKRR